MPAAVLSRDEAVDRILAVFRQHGYEGASLARLSAATGLGRSSLYHHFPSGKEDMANAAMAAVGAWFRDNVLSTLDGSDPPKKRLRRFAEKLAEFYRGGEQSCLTDVFTIGEAGTVFQKHFAARLQHLIAALRAVAIEAGIPPAEASRRAENAVMKLHGALVVSRALGSTAPFVRMIREFPDDLLQSHS
jgi:AcrR family transcriptional regulator